MSKANQINIQITENIDRHGAEEAVTRIRAAMRNKIPHIKLVFQQDVLIMSAEFLSFLSASVSYLKEKDMKLTILQKQLQAINCDLQRGSMMFAE